MTKSTRRPNGLTMAQAFAFYMPGEPPIDGACWDWTGSPDKHGGYGRLNIHGRLIRASRVSYLLYNGPLLADEMVRHTCDRPICVAPVHLIIGTHADNMADMVARRRHARGERRPNSRVTEAIVHEIRARYAAGLVSQQRLADEYGISQMAVSKIIRRETWKHI